MNIAKVREFLKENKFDGMMLRKRKNFSWVTEGKVNHIVQATESGVCDLLVFEDKAYAITVKMEERRLVEEELADVPFQIEVISDDWYKGSDHLIERLAMGKKMVTDSPFLDWPNIDDLLTPLRSVLSDAEIIRYRSLCKDTATIVETVAKQIQPGQTEFEIAAMLYERTVASSSNVQVALVATDERIYKYRHPIPTKKQLERHAMLVLCAERGGLVANVTRFVHFGNIPEEMRSRQENLATIDVAMNTATRPGQRIGDVVKAGIRHYQAAGFPEDWKLLHQGGLTGYNSREYLATPDSQDLIEVNQVYTWNPALPGVKSEDTILVKEQDNEFLTHTGNWVYVDVHKEGKHYQRPGILER